MTGISKKSVLSVSPNTNALMPLRQSIAARKTTIRMNSTISVTRRNP